MSYNINDVLNALTSSYSNNIKVFTDTFGSLNYKDKYGNSLYHLIMRSDANTSTKVLGVFTLIYAGVDASSKNDWGDNFLHTAIRMHLPISAVGVILDELKKKRGRFLLNDKNRDGDTLFHVGVYSITDEIDLLALIKILRKHHFDFSVCNNRGESCASLINSCYRFSENYKKEILLIMNESSLRRDKMNDDDDRTSRKIVNRTDNIDKYGTILNEKEYNNPCAIGRDEEIKKIIVSLATGDKLPILVGPSGVGKTTIVDELVYRIKNGMVPKFLADKIVYEVHTSSILAGTKYRGSLEENLKEIFDFVTSNDALLFLDEFHTVFGAGSTDSDKTDAAGMIKTYIDRYNLQVIGATTSYEYEEYMAKDALKRRFDVIKIEELDHDKLYDVVLHVIENISTRRDIGINRYVIDNIKEIAQILITLTDNKNRKYDDKIYNPDLVISIIKRAFAYVLVSDDEELMLKHIIMSIEDCERLYPSSKEIAIKNLNEIDTKTKPLVREKVISFNAYKKEL